MLRERMPTVDEALEALTNAGNATKTLAEMKEEIEVLTTAYTGMAKGVNDRLEQDRFEGRNTRW